MEDQNFLELILGNFSGAYIAAFYFYMILGQALMMAIHYMVKKERESFKIKYWFADNWARALASVIITFALLMFTSEFAPNYEPNMYFGFVIGLTMDLIIIGFRKYTKVNIFESKKLKDATD